MKKLNENTKVTLTLKQLEALVKEAKKVKPPRYTIQQYCDMRGLDADKLMAAMKAHWSILSPPLTDRTTFPEHALDTYAERYADEMSVKETTGGALVENSQGLIDQVLENPEVRAAAERFVNRFIEDIAEYEEFDNKLADYITTGDEFRFKKLKEAIRNVMNNYNGPK